MRGWRTSATSTPPIVGSDPNTLVFYVVYTVWYGFAIIFMFEGWGLKLSH